MAKNQYWLVSRVAASGRKLLYLCNAVGREGAKRSAHSFLLGNPDDYTVTPLSNPGEVTELRINLSATQGEDDVHAPI